MRPTYLQFRSPKEQTGEFLNPAMTTSGKTLHYKPKEYAKCTFSNEQRWGHIRQISCRTSGNVGPGCYNVKTSTNRGISPKMVRPSATFTDGWDYIYVGDSIMKKERPLSRANSTMRSSKGFYSESSPVHDRSRLTEPGFPNTMTRPNHVRAASTEKRRYFRTESNEDSPYLIQNNSNQRSSDRNFFRPEKFYNDEKPREKGFYERLNEQWPTQQKIILKHSPKRKPDGREQVQRFY